jgi:hypothetical protein
MKCEKYSEPKGLGECGGHLCMELDLCDCRGKFFATFTCVLPGPEAPQPAFSGDEAGFCLMHLR